MSVDRTPRPPLWRRPGPVLGLLAVALLAVMAATTTVVRPGDALAAGTTTQAFSAEQYAAEKYDSEVVPTVVADAQDLPTLLAQIIADPQAAGEQHGHQSGATSPFSYAVTGQGVAGAVKGTLLPLTIEGVPADVQVMLQIGPAINGTALRDATGLIDFNDFLNQIEYADAATELNNAVKREVLAGFDAAAAEGKTVTFTGAFAYGSNTAVLQITPVELEVAP